LKKKAPEVLKAIRAKQSNGSREETAKRGNGYRSSQLGKDELFLEESKRLVDRERLREKPIIPLDESWNLAEHMHKNYFLLVLNFLFDEIHVE
jgi:hypothetical protein